MFGRTGIINILTNFSIGAQTVGFACALGWINAIQVAIADPGIELYCLSSMEILRLGFISLSSESLSDKYLLLLFGFVSFCTIRLLFIMCT